jgi:hypothetical protein
MEAIPRFQSTLHPKVKGIDCFDQSFAVSTTVSIRPSPKGEGNHFFFYFFSLLF